MFVVIVIHASKEATVQRNDAPANALAIPSVRCDRNVRSVVSRRPEDVNHAPLRPYKVVTDGSMVGKAGKGFEWVAMVGDHALKHIHGLADIDDLVAIK